MAIADGMEAARTAMTILPADLLLHRSMHPRAAPSRWLSVYARILRTAGSRC